MTENMNAYNFIVTAHAKNDDSLIISLLPTDQWEMITSTATSLGMAAEDIIRELGPDEVVQYEISSDDWNDFFTENQFMNYDDLFGDNGDDFNPN